MALRCLICTGCGRCQPCNSGGALIAPRKFRKLSSISACCGRGFIFQTATNTLKSQPLSVGIFFARSPSKTAFGLASVASAAARFSARFPQIPLSVISRDASARDATSSVFNDLQAAGSISILVGRLGAEKGLARYARIHAGSADAEGLPLPE